MAQPLYIRRSSYWNDGSYCGLLVSPDGGGAGRAEAISPPAIKLLSDLEAGEWLRFCSFMGSGKINDCESLVHAFPGYG